MHLYFDIETIPCQDAGHLEKLRGDVKAPGNIKKPESIEKWLDENRDAAAADAMAKTSFDGGRGHVCAIGMAAGDAPVWVEYADTLERERAVIAAFFDCVDHRTILVGHNITGFDLWFLRQRAIVLGVPMPPSNAFPRDPKPWDRNVVDTMHAWAGARDTVSLDNLCGILGIPGKDGFDGSMVADAWANGEHDTIREYCADDVNRVREIHKRMVAAKL